MLDETDADSRERIHLMPGDLGSWVGDALAHSGMTQQTLADRLGYPHRVTVNKMVHGRRDLSAYDVLAIASITRTPLPWAAFGLTPAPEVPAAPLTPRAPRLTLSPVDDFPARWGDELGPDIEAHPSALMLGRVLVIAAVLIPVALIAARLAGWV